MPHFSSSFFLNPVSQTAKPILAWHIKNNLTDVAPITVCFLFLLKNRNLAEKVSLCWSSFNARTINAFLTVHLPVWGLSVSQLSWRYQIISFLVTFIYIPYLGKLYKGYSVLFLFQWNCIKMWSLDFFKCCFCFVFVFCIL